MRICRSLDTDHQIVDPLRHQKEARVVERANRAIKESNNAIITHQSVSTGRILPSGDIILRAESLEDVEQLARAAKDWCLAFGDSATIKRRTYRVVMNGVNCQLDLAAAPACIKADNLGCLAPHSDHIHWVASWPPAYCRTQTRNIKADC